jgi:multisubunit Na+/H+ antiporter MnhF subunit
MLERISLYKALWVPTALLSLGAALVGAAHPAIYRGLMTPAMVPGAVSQDAVTVVVALFLLIWGVRAKEQETVKHIVILGLLGYLFYGYGIWVIERAYNPLYLVYLAIFALSFWSLVCGIATVRRDLKVTLGKLAARLSIGWALLNPVVFYPLWISQLLPLLLVREKAEHFYSIYILDLALVMPAFLVLAYLTAKGRALGAVLLPALFVKGFVLLFSVGLGGLIAPLYHQPADMGQVWFYLILAAVNLCLALSHLVGLRTNGAADECRPQVVNRRSA